MINSYIPLPLQKVRKNEQPLYIAVGLGTNVEPRVENLKGAIELLKNSVFAKEVSAKISSWHYSRACVPWGSKDLRPTQYINCIMAGWTSFTPIDLLGELKKIEVLFGRDLAAKRWSPRQIDLDIIVYNNEPFENLKLTIPHPRAIERRWVLEPLHEVWPNAFIHHTQEKIDIDVAKVLEYYAGVANFEQITPAI